MHRNQNGGVSHDKICVCDRRRSVRSRQRYHGGLPRTAFEELPVSMDCELADIIDTEDVYAMVGKIVNICAEDRVIGEDGKANPDQIHALIFDQFRNGYYAVGEKVGQAWNAGKDLVRKAKD